MMTLLSGVIVYFYRIMRWIGMLICRTGEGGSFGVQALWQSLLNITIFAKLQSFSNYYEGLIIILEFKRFPP